MAINDFGVAAADVKRRLPIDTSPIGTGTEPISDSDITDAIDDKASEMAGVLEQTSTQASDLSDEAQRQIQNAIADGAAAEILQEIGHTGSDYQARRDRYIALRDEYRSDSTLDRDRSRVDARVADSDEESDFRGTHWKM